MRHELDGVDGCDADGGACADGRSDGRMCGAECDVYGCFSESHDDARESVSFGGDGRLVHPPDCRCRVGFDDERGDGRIRKIARTASQFEGSSLEIRLAGLFGVCV